MALDRLVFVETWDQAATLERSPLLDSTTVVALTGNAEHALGELGVSHHAVSEFALPRISAEVEGQLTLDCVDILASLEHFMVDRDERASRVEGFLVDQAYHATFSVSGIAIPFFLMSKTIERLAPKTVSIFPANVEPWFAGDGYSEAPWTPLLETLAGGRGFELERLTAASGSRAPRTVPRRRRRLTRAPRRLRRLLSQPRLAAARGSTRLLFIGYPRYDWGPVVDALRRRRSAACYWIDNVPFDPARSWTFALVPRVALVGSTAQHDLGAAFTGSAAEQARYGALFDAWFDEMEPTLEVDGVDLMPALARHFRSLAEWSPLLAEHADATADAALDRVRPDATCFFSMPWLSGKRVARRAQLRGIPVLCYQHGGAYGTHRLLSHELMDWAYADDFLSYGEGIRPPQRPTFPLRARFVPVGSAAAATAARPQRPGRGRVTRVLWLGEYVTNNAYAYGMGEDTHRYLVEAHALQRLSAASQLDVTFRPYPGQVTTNDVVDLIDRKRLQITVDTVRPLPELISHADIVITDTHSGTVWNQVLAAGAPLVIACDPADFTLDEEFAAELSRACCVCTSDSSLADLLQRLAHEPREVVAELRRQDPRRFLERYVLQHGDPVSRVVSLVESMPTREFGRRSHSHSVTEDASAD
jgi:hypothetical protein